MFQMKTLKFASEIYWPLVKDTFQPREITAILYVLAHSGELLKDVRRADTYIHSINEKVLFDRNHNRTDIVSDIITHLPS